MNPDTGNKTENGYAIGNSVTSDAAIRKALNIGIDRQALIDGALNGQGKEEFTGVDKLPWGNKEAIFKDGDIEEAKKILSYSVASVSGTVLAVCSCTVLPLFAGAMVPDVRSPDGGLTWGPEIVLRDDGHDGEQPRRRHRPRATG